MIKRFLLLVFGLGVGVAVGAVVMRRVDRAARAVAPGTLANQAVDVAATLGERLRAAWDETRAVAADEEAELRTRFEIPSARDLVRRG